MKSDLFSHAERYPVPISSFAIPSDISILGPTFGDQSYYADFAGIAKKYAPAPCAILEIGVRFGYSAVAMCLGAQAANPEWHAVYYGIDACFFSHPQDPSILSHELADRHIREHAAPVEPNLYRWDTREGLPTHFSEFDYQSFFRLINVDGDHSCEGCYRDLTNVWPLAAPGAIVIVDDTGMAEVHRAVCQFRDERADAGELAGFTWHQNERGFAIFQKVE